MAAYIRVRSIPKSPANARTRSDLLGGSTLLGSPDAEMPGTGLRTLPELAWAGRVAPAQPTNVIALASR